MNKVTKEIIEYALWARKRDLQMAQDSLKHAVAHRGRCQAGLNAATTGETQAAEKAQKLYDDFSALLSDYRLLGGSEGFIAEVGRGVHEQRP